MERRRNAVRGGLVASVSLLGAIALFATASFACTPQASLKVTPGSGAPGTNVTVTGSTFDAAGQQVKVFFGGASKTQVATATVTSGRTFSATFVVPQTDGGAYIVAATQLGADGNYIAGSPVNTIFRVEAPAPGAPASNLQSVPDNTLTEPVPVPIAAPAAATTATPAPAGTPRVRVASPSRTVAPAPVAAAPVAPAPVAPAPAVESTPAPAVAAPTPIAPATEAPAAAPARRSVMVSMASDGSDGSPALAIALVGIGLLLALGASAVVLSSRRDSKAPAEARR